MKICPGAAGSNTAYQGAESVTQKLLQNFDVVRGILILVVMFDHNDIIRNVRSVNAWFLPMTFHVAGFLLLPFLTPSKRLSCAMVADHAIRYLVPFFFALLAYALAFQFVIVREPIDLDWLARIAAGFFFADTGSLHDSTGFIVLWFLPALLSTVILLAIFNSAAKIWRISLAALCVCVHVAIGAVPVFLRNWVPQGLLLALYIFPLGLIAQFCAHLPFGRKSSKWAVAIATIILLATWRFERGTEVEVATLVVPSLMKPAWIMATDASDLSFLFILIICAPVVANIPAIRMLGKNSLLVYLIHPILYKPILAIFFRYCTLGKLAAPLGAVEYWAGAAASVVTVGAISLAAALAVGAVPSIRTLVIPRGVDDWLPVAKTRAIRDNAF